MRFIYLLLLIITISSTLASLYKRNDAIWKRLENSDNPTVKIPDSDNKSTDNPTVRIPVSNNESTDSPSESTPNTQNSITHTQSSTTHTQGSTNTQDSTDNTQDSTNNTQDSTNNTQSSSGNTQSSTNNAQDSKDDSDNSTSTEEIMNIPIIKINPGNFTSTDNTTEEDTPECQKFKAEFDKCFPNELSNFNDELCNKVYSSECQALLNGDNCGKNNITYEYRALSFKFGCAKDEKGNYCPQNKIINDESNINRDNIEFLDVTKIREICQSKACTENALDYFEKMHPILVKLSNVNPYYYNELVTGVSKAIDVLNDDSCKVKTSSSFILIGGIILGGVVIIVISILVALRLIKKSKKSNNNNNVEINSNLEERDSNTSSGRIVFLNQPQLPNTTDTDNYNILIPPPAYDNRNMVMTANDNKHELNLNTNTVVEEEDKPPEYSEINELIENTNNF